MITDDVDDDDGYDDDDDGDDCGYAIRPMEVFEITNLWSQLDGIRITSCAYQIEITSSPLSEVARQCEAWSILPTPWGPVPGRELPGPVQQQPRTRACL